MELSISKAKFGPKVFILVALILLSAGMLFGTVGGLQYVLPGFLKEALSFEKTRPIHVSSVLFWILFASMGAVFTYIKEYTGKEIYSKRLARLQFLLFIFSVISILLAYSFGVFGGREYWEFPPILSAPIIIAWILFLINYVRSIGSFKNQPVFIWMWFTGIVFSSLLFQNLTYGSSHILTSRS